VNRRKFIKGGIAGIAVGVVGPACDPSDVGSLGGDAGSGPRVADAGAQNNVIRLTLSKSTIPTAAWDDAVALIALGREVIANPESAVVFSRDPKRYLADHALGHVQVNPDSFEVKIALALGDPEIRDAIRRHDVRGALAALERRGLLSSKAASPLPAKIKSLYLASVDPSAGGVTPDLPLLLFALLWVVVVAIQDVYVAVAFGVYLEIVTVAVVDVDTIGSSAVEALQQQRVVTRSPGLRAAAILGGPQIATELSYTWIAEQTEAAAVAIEGLDFYRVNPMDPAKLRELIRSTVQTYLQQ
jgi:hypothetical protein